MPQIHTGAIPTGMLSPQMKIKRAVSGYIDTDAAAVPLNISPIMYTSTAITITAVNVYVVDQIQGAGFQLDVGINADDDAIVDAQAIGATAADEVVAGVINGSASVAAGKVITASTETQDGTGGTIQVSIDYTESDT